MAKNPYDIRSFPGYTVKILRGSKPLNPKDDNVDVEVLFENGERYIATIFTIRNIATLLSRWERTGESGNGLYFWATHAIVVRHLTGEVICDTVAALLSDGEFYTAFEGPLPSDGIE